MGPCVTSVKHRFTAGSWYRPSTFSITLAARGEGLKPRKAVSPAFARTPEPSTAPSDLPNGKNSSFSTTRGNQCFTRSAHTVESCTTPSRYDQGEELLLPFLVAQARTYPLSSKDRRYPKDDFLKHFHQIISCGLRDCPAPARYPTFS